MMNKVNNDFWKEVLSDLLEMYLCCEGKEDAPSQPLWYNSKIKVGNKTIFYSKWYDKGILQVDDMLDIMVSF